MNGRVLDYSFQNDSGTIAGSDGSRYTFTGVQWKAQGTPSPGMQVTFDADGTKAVSICLSMGALGGAPVGAKSKGTAVLLAIFLGAFCAHHFYLGRYRAAISWLFLYPFVVLGGSPVGMKWWPVPFLVLAAIILGIVGLIHGITYLVKSDEDFHQAYVADRRS